MMAKSVNAEPEKSRPKSVVGAERSAVLPTSPYITMKTTKKMAQAYFSYVRTARRPTREKTTPTTATITTPRAELILPSVTLLRAIPPVMPICVRSGCASLFFVYLLPTLDHPNCSTTFKNAIILLGHHPREYRLIETCLKPVGAP